MFGTFGNLIKSCVGYINPFGISAQERARLQKQEEKRVQDLEKEDMMYHLKHMDSPESWKKVNELLQKKHCSQHLIMNYQKVNWTNQRYIYAVTNGYYNLSDCMNKWIWSRGYQGMKMLREALEHPNVEFIKNMTIKYPHILDSRVCVESWQCKLDSGVEYGITSALLKKNMTNFKELCQHPNFPRQECLVQFIKDLQKETDQGGDCSATKEAIKILIEVSQWSLGEYDTIIDKIPSLSQEMKNELSSIIRLHIFEVPPIKRLGGENKTLDQEAPKSPDKKHEEPEADIVIEEGDKPTVIQKSAEKVNLTAEWFPLTYWQKTTLQKIATPPMVSGYPLLKQHTTPLLLCWHPENNENNKSFLGDVLGVEEGA